MQLKSSLVMLASAVLSTYFFALPAYADEAPSPAAEVLDQNSEVQPSAAAATCPGKTLCLWDDRSFGGALIFKKKTLGIEGIPWAHNDDASSGWNKTTYTAWLYFDANGAGSKYCLPSGYAESNFNNVPGLNDEVSSVELTSRSNCPSGSSTIGTFKGY